MKRTIIIGSLFLAATAWAQTGPLSPAPTTAVHVTTDSEIKDLARGYAHASTALSHPPISLAFQKEGVLRVIDDVRTIRDNEGILVVVVGTGLSYLINPRDVVYITDGVQIKPKM